MIPQGQEDVVRAVGRWMSRKDKVQIQQMWMCPVLPVKHSHECFGTQSMSNPRKTWGSKIGFCGFGIWVRSGALNRERRWIQIFGTMSKQLIMLICKAYMCNPFSLKQWLKGREVATPTWCVHVLHEPDVVQMRHTVKWRVSFRVSEKMQWGKNLKVSRLFCPLLFSVSKEQLVFLSDLNY